MKKTVLVLSLFVLLFASPAAGFELPEPDHGVEDEFDKLWSGYNYDPPSEGNSVNEYLTKGSDYVYSEPPGAPDEWNEGEAGEFDGAGAQASVYPPDTDLHDGEAIKDAYVRIFGVSRSTRVLFSPNEEVVYVPTDGEVRAFADYRIEGENVISHSFEASVVGSDETVSDNGGISIPYELSSGGGARRDRTEPGDVPAAVGGDTVDLTLRGEFTATRMVGDETETETVVVEDTLEVKPYDPDAPPPISIQGRYPDNDSALFFLREEPWSSVSLPDGTTVHSNWRFFSARDTDWDDVMRFSTSQREGRADQRYHPLRLYAYPSRSGIHAGGGDADVQNVFGNVREPPSLPDRLNFDLPTTEYKTVQGFDVRYSGEADTGDVEMKGIVRGTTVERPSFPAVQRIRETNLTLSVAGRNEDTDTVDVEVALTDGEGNPIDTRDKDGFVRVEGHEDAETGIDGKTVVEVSPPPSGVVVAEYVPDRWYEAETPYVGDIATLDAGERFRLLEEIGVLSQLGVFLLPFLLLVYFTDRMLGLGIWPPWRRI